MPVFTYLPSPWHWKLNLNQLTQNCPLLSTSFAITTISPSRYPLSLG